MPDDTDVTKIKTDIPEHMRLRFISEVLETTGPLHDDEIEQAYDKFEELFVDESILRLWREGKIKFGWTDESMELVLYPASYTPGEPCRP